MLAMSAESRAASSMPERLLAWHRMRCLRLECPPIRRGAPTGNAEGLAIQYPPLAASCLKIGRQPVSSERVFVPLPLGSLHPRPPSPNGHEVLALDQERAVRQRGLHVG